MEKPVEENKKYFCHKCAKKNVKSELKFNESSKVDEDNFWICSSCKFKYKNKSSKEPLIRKYYPKNSIVLTQRDYCIEAFLDRVGWSNYEQICQYLKVYDEFIMPDYNLTVKNLQPRLSLLVKFGRLRSARTHDNTYFALTKKSKQNNELVGNLRVDRLAHENYIINELVLKFPKFAYLFPREIRAQTPVGVKSGPIPDLIVLDDDFNDAVHVEYERTAKSTQDIGQSILNWIWSPRKSKFGDKTSVLVICETDEIYNRYVRVLKTFKTFKTNYVFDDFKIIYHSEGIIMSDLKILLKKRKKVDLDKDVAKFEELFRVFDNKPQETLDVSDEKPTEFDNEEEDLYPYVETIQCE